MSDGFRDFPLLDSLQVTLKELGFIKPTEIQRFAIPALLEKRSLVGIAETGSGKTLAYVLPVLHLLKTKEAGGERVQAEGRPRALVIVPMRELGEQVAKEFKKFTHGTRLRVRSVLGGTAIETAKENVKGEFEVLVATPGRLVQMLQRKQVDLSDIHTMILDEADQMVDQGFIADITRIVAQCPDVLQLSLFSATVSPDVQKIIEDVFEGVEIFRTKGSHKVVATLKTENLEVIDGKRWPVLEKLLASDYEGGTLIFTNTREQCDKLADQLDKAGIEYALYRGEMDKNERRANLKAFRTGEIKVLISTDLASRGLDVESVGRVINYHMPQVLENYLHRVGRTARAGREGVAINFVTERDEPMMEQLKSVRTSAR
jgi:ATP-dependent RNA helicase RhlE